MQEQNQASVGAGVQQAQAAMEVRILPSAQAVAVFESRGFARPDHGEQVDRIKYLASALWTEIDKIAVPPGNSEPGRLLSLAKTDLEGSVMWAVKAISRFSPPSYQDPTKN